ncbi:MAG: DUF5057 domain-containing protein [Lachnospiraceae bacterium]|nr:DUF5057 domain-containing protein [Lachnospiraceae bacterium]
MKKLNRKMKFSLFALLFVIITSGVIIGTRLLVQASAIMPGVEKIVQEICKVPGDKFRILEIVPESGDGEIGYYADGQEYNYLTKLLQRNMLSTTSTGDAATRKAFIESEIAKLRTKNVCAPASGDSSLYPMSYGTYEESMFLPSENPEQWHELTFPSTYRQEVDATGNYIAAATPGTGLYAKLATIAGFEVATGNGQYAVEFQQGNAGGAGTALIQYGAYQLIEGTTHYKKVGNTYIDDSYFYVKSEPILKTDGAVGDFAYNALQIFEYREANDGDYNFVPDANASMHRVSLGKVYYKSGITNNNWMKNKVFGAADNETFQIEVTTLTPGELNAIAYGDIPNYDMVYICGDTQTGNFTYGDTRGTTTDNINYTNDISWGRTSTLIAKIAEEKVACIVDYSIFSKVTSGIETVSSSNVYKLAVACLQADLATTYGDNFKNNPDEPNASIWTSLWGTVEPGCSHNFAKGNIYCVYNTKSTANTDINRGLVTNLFQQKFVNSATIPAGFLEVKKLIASENAIRSGSDLLSTDISQVTAVQFIINARNARQITAKSSLHVLEIQPCYSFDLKGKPAVVAQWAANLGIPASNITIDSMTTAEFIGKINDINKDYDLVYFGLNTGRMNKATNGTTKYNDTSMNGLIYTHTGDAILCEDNIGGLLNTDYVGSNTNNYLYGEGFYKLRQFGRGVINLNTLPTESITLRNALSGRNETYSVGNIGAYRYSGNDITTKKQQDLMEFVQAKYAVVVDERFFNTSADGVNASLVDNSTNLYQFLKNVKTSDNVVTSRIVSANNITVDTSRGTFDYYLNMPKPILNLDCTLADTGAQKSLVYNFSIASSVEVSYATQYSVDLYFDINADGKYKSEELQSGCYIVDSNDVEAEKDASGNYLLYSGVSYKLTKSIPNSYVGTIPWKMEVAQLANNVKTYVRTSLEGYKTLASTATTAETINILQIIQPTNDGSTTLILDNNPSTAIQGSTAFINLLRDPSLAGYNIIVTSVRSDAYAASFVSQAKIGKNYLDQYNMVILGFADVYKEISNAQGTGNLLNMGPVDGILNFINRGKSVLFTHDTTSFVNVQDVNKYKSNNADGTLKAGQGSYWGVNFNTLLRNVVGMDRYGITNSTNSFLKNGNILNIADHTNWVSNDKAFVAGSNKTQTYGETQGFSDNLLTKFALQGKNQLYQSTYSEVRNTGNGSYGNTMYAKRINQGLITSYPFTIPEDLVVASTHYQYYQLDMEADDIVVWYTLSTVKNGTTEIANLYQTSPNDVRNNYYIYSKGNVMYSGVGHSTADSGDELKLFVNTMIASYKNGVKPPNISILNNASIGSGIKKYTNVTFDESMVANGALNEGTLDTNMDLYYTVDDPNITTSAKTLSVEYYYADSNSATTIMDGLHVTPIVLQTYQMQGAAAIAINSNALASGNVYKVTIPNAYSYLLGNKSTAEVYVKVKSEYDYYGQQVVQENYGTLTLVRTQLFNLN